MPGQCPESLLAFHILRMYGMLTHPTKPRAGPMVYTEEDVATLVNTGQTEPRKAGERMAGSYVNFYIANEAVVVPQFGVPQVRPCSVRCV